jgi:hypothetical protein
MPLGGIRSCIGVLCGHLKRHAILLGISTGYPIPLISWQPKTLKPLRLNSLRGFLLPLQNYCLTVQMMGAIIGTYPTGFVPR